MNDAQTIKETMKKNAADNGYFLCPDPQLFDDLINGLATNTKRYGYGSCPCRIASGKKTYDADIICPCEYRDADVDEYGMCYCGLFVNTEVHKNPALMGPIPERRPREIQDAALAAAEAPPSGPKEQTTSGKTLPKKQGLTVWRCTVCGYLCARELPPPICPICKAKAERFEPFTIQ
jgi:ferredoxin-thioredoxin reductase catalytic subunit